MELIDFTTLQTVLWWVVGSGSTVWMLMVSNVFRNLTEGELHDKQPFIQKVGAWLILVKNENPITYMLLITSASFSGPVVAAIILFVVPAEIIEQLQQYYGFAILWFMAFIAQQGFYQITKGPSADEKLQQTIAQEMGVAARISAAAFFDPIVPGHKSWAAANAIPYVDHQKVLAQLKDAQDLVRNLDAELAKLREGNTVTDVKLVEKEPKDLSPEELDPPA